MEDEHKLTDVERIKRENAEFINSRKLKIMLLFFEDYPEQIFSLSRLEDLYQSQNPFYEHLFLVVAGLAGTETPFSQPISEKYRLRDKYQLLINDGYSSKTIYRFLKTIRENSYTPEQAEAFLSDFQNEMINQPECLFEDFCDKLKEEYQRNISASEVIQRLNNKVVGGDVPLEKQIAAFEYFLSRKEELCTVINQHNLSYLQKIRRDFFPMITEEKRLCKEPPKPSKSALLQTESIKKQWTHKSGRDVYLIQREYRIPIQNTSSLSGYRSAYHWANTMKFNSNTERHIFFEVPPYVTPGTIAYRCRFEITFRRLLQLAQNRTCFSQQAFNDRAISVFHAKYYPVFKEKITGIFEKILEQDFSGSLHGPLFPYIGLPKTVLTPSVLEHLLSLPVNRLREDWDFLVSLSLREPHEKMKEETRLLRKTIYQNFRKGLPPKEIESLCNKYLEQRIIKEYNLSHAQLKQITEHYLPVAQRYKQRKMTLAEFLRIFGKNGIRTILNPEKDCVFQPAVYTLPSMEKTVLASLVHERLGTMEDKENLSARQRLYHRLDVICPVKDILKGNFPEEDIPRIKKAMNLSPDKTLNLAGYFSAKIEEKCSPEFLIAGDASVCCMGLGSEKAVNYALEPGFGIFNVYFKDRIIANSLLWVNNEDTLVIDNIEVHQNYKQHDAYIREMYHQVIKDMHRIYPNIVQGSSHNDLKLYTDKCSYGTLKERNPVKITGHFYSDARNTCYLIRGDEAILKKRIPERFFNEDDEEEGLQIVNAF